MSPLASVVGKVIFANVVTADGNSWKVLPTCKAGPVLVTDSVPA